MPLASLIAVQFNIHPGPVLPGQVTGWDSGVGAAECASEMGTRVIHRIMCHAGVTGLCREGRRYWCPQEGACSEYLALVQLRPYERYCIVRLVLCCSTEDSYHIIVDGQLDWCICLSRNTWFSCDYIRWCWIFMTGVQYFHWHRMCTGQRVRS
jgi:hypothetical protein